MTAAVASPVQVRPTTARRTGPSLPAAVWLEVRKSLSTRSGLALVVSAVLLAPAAIAMAAGASRTAETTRASPERVESDLRTSSQTAEGSDGPVRRAVGRT